MLKIDCPVCGQADVWASTWDLFEDFTVLLFLRLFTVHSSWLCCSHCRATLVSRLPIAELADRHAEERSYFIRPHVSIVVKTLAICGAVCFFVPIIGTLLNGLTLILLWKSPGWLRRTSLVFFCLSLLISVFFILLMIFHAPKK